MKKTTCLCFLFSFSFMPFLVHANFQNLKRYSNKQLGLNFTYPENLFITNADPYFQATFSAIKSVRERKIHPVPLIALAPKPQNSWSDVPTFTVWISSANDCKEEFQGQTTENYLPNIVTIGENRFMLNYSGGGAAGTFFHTANYIGQVNGSCWEVQFFSTNPSNGGVESEKRRKSGWLVFLRVFKSFVFDKQLAQPGAQPDAGTGRKLTP